LSEYDWLGARRYISGNAIKRLKHSEYSPEQAYQGSNRRYVGKPFDLKKKPVGDTRTLRCGVFGFFYSFYRLCTTTP
jgi:hypothetical protein